MQYNIVTLNWQKIKHFREFVFIEEKCRAIYIWGFNSPSGFIPYYVGKSNNLKKRIFEHLFMLMGGAYNIYNIKDLTSFKKDDSLVYSPRSLDLIIKFIDRYEEYKPYIKEMIDKFYFTYAIVENKDYLADLEKSVIASIGKDNIVNHQSGHPKIYKHHNSGNEEVINILSKYSLM